MSTIHTRLMITVVIPALDAADTITDCIRSVMDCHANASVAQIIVVDGCSSDATVSLAQTEGARVVSNPARHVAAARQAGLMYATTPIVAYLDADCIAAPDWISTILDRFTNEALCGIGGPYISNAVDDPYARFAASTFESVMGFSGDGHSVQSKSVRGCIVGGNCAFSVSDLKDIGGFDVTLGNHGEDIDVAWRLVDAGRLVLYDPKMQVRHRYVGGLGSLVSTWFRYGVASSMLAKRHLPTPAIDLRLHRAMLTSLAAMLLSPKENAPRVAQLGAHLTGKLVGSCRERIINL